MTPKKAGISHVYRPEFLPHSAVKSCFINKYLIHGRNKTYFSKVQFYDLKLVLYWHFEWDTHLVGAFPALGRGVGTRYGSLPTHLLRHIVIFQRGEFRSSGLCWALYTPTHTCRDFYACFIIPARSSDESAAKKHPTWALLRLKVLLRGEHAGSNHCSRMQGGELHGLWAPPCPLVPCPPFPRRSRRAGRGRAGVPSAGAEPRGAAERGWGQVRRCHRSTSPPARPQGSSQESILAGQPSPRLGGHGGGRGRGGGAPGHPQRSAGGACGGRGEAARPARAGWTIPQTHAESSWQQRAAFGLASPPRSVPPPVFFFPLSLQKTWLKLGRAFWNSSSLASSGPGLTSGRCGSSSCSSSSTS